MQSELTKTIPVLTLWQPWASAVVTPHPKYPDRGLKEYETRAFSTKIRGRILIHSAKKWESWMQDLLFNGDVFRKYHIMYTKEGKQVLDPISDGFGYIIGSVIIEDIIASETFAGNAPFHSKTPLDEYNFGNWLDGRFGWKLSNPVRFEESIPLKGKQQILWPYPISELSEQYQKLIL